MKRYIINYDLNIPGKDYGDLISAITRYPYAKLCKSCWAVNSTKTAHQIFTELRQHIDDNDTLFVCDFSDWSGYIPTDAIEWLNN